MRKNDLSVFKMESEGFKITLKRGADPIITTAPVGATYALPAAAPVATTAAPAASAEAPASAGGGEKLREITSPMVGTFYASPAPDAQPFVKIGQKVDETTVVCIIEAMKVMNEIKAEISGEILEVLVENGEPVEFGQPLFLVKTD